jgi:hypothetical protein
VRNHPDPSRGASALYVATDLHTWEAEPPIPANQDAICEQVGYRRLDPSYYAWLRSRMELARSRYATGRLEASQFEVLRARFNPVHAWALARFGEPALRRAIASVEVARYAPPAVQEALQLPAPRPAEHLYPSAGDWRFTHPVAREAVTKVDAVRDQALALGWSEASLYQNRGHLRFPVGGDYGLVCFLHGGRELGQVTRDHIEIIAPSGSRLRYRNPALDQPWIGHTRPTDIPPPSDTSPFGPVYGLQENG